MAKIKIIQKLTFSFVVIILLFSLIIIYINNISESSTNEIIKAQQIQEEIYQLEKSISRLFSLTKDYILIEETQDSGRFRSKWVSYLYEVNEHSYILKEQNIDPNVISVIEENVNKGSDVVDGLIDTHDILISAEEDAKARLKENEQSYLKDISDIQTKTEEDLTTIEKTSNKNVQNAINNKNRVLFISQLLVLVTSILALFFSIFISFSISKPITNLHKGVEEVEKGNLDFKVGTKSSDEVGQLSRSFDKMTESLKKSKEILEKYNKELEEKVKKKTEELEEKNKELEETLDDFYTLRIGMQRDTESGKLEEENKKIKKRLDRVKKSKEEEEKKKKKI